MVLEAEESSGLAGIRTRGEAEASGGEEVTGYLSGEEYASYPPPGNLFREEVFRAFKPTRLNRELGRVTG
jgi:hypothetical protein